MALLASVSSLGAGRVASQRAWHRGPRGAHAAAPRWTARLAGVLPHLPVAVLIVVYGIRFSLLSVSVFDGYGSPAFDMGIPDQGIWLLSRFHAPFVTIMGRNLFADHTSFILALLVPLYWVYPHTAALLVVQSWLLALGAIPVYLLARRLLGRAGTVLPTALAGAYLLNPALQWGNLEQFHTECFLVVLIGIAVYAAVESRPRLLWLSVVGCLLCKEDAAVLVIPLGVVIAYRGQFRRGALLVVTAVAAAAFSTEVVILSLLGVTTAHGGRLPFGGVGGLIRTAWQHPLRLWAYLRRDGRPFYVWQMAASAGLAFLRAPQIALIGLGTVGVNVISDFGYMHRIQYHYSMPLVPVLALGTVWGVSRLSTPRRRQVATALVVGAALWACALWGLAPFSRHSYPHQSPHAPAVRSIDAVSRFLPANAVVSADYSIVPHIDHRARIYMWPNPFWASYWGTYHQEGRRLPFADQVQYVMIPTAQSGVGARVWASVAHQFRLVAENGGYALYQRIP